MKTKWTVLTALCSILYVSVVFAQKTFQVEQNLDIQASENQGKRWALLVGIADYPVLEGYEIQPLRAPVKDVNALAAFLKDPQRGGFEADHVFTLTDARATRRDILITFNNIAKRAAPEDMVLFYFSGHGYRPNGGETTYLIPYDFDMSDLDTTCINFDDLAMKIQKMEARKVVVILDACNSGGIKPRGARASANTGLVRRYLEAFEQSEGRALLLSSDESEVSWETEQNGVFTHFLLEGLNGKADTNGDGIITFTEVGLYVETTVPKYTREHFPRVQRPVRRYEFGPVRGDIPLAINWSVHETFRQKERRDMRTGAILQASLEGLDQTLKEFSLDVAQSAYRKALNGEPLTNPEKLLLPEIDALQAGKITVADYIVRVRAIHRLDTPLTQLHIAVIPTDATVTLTSGDTPNHVIEPFSPNVYRVSQGQYHLSVQRSGYAPNSQDIILDKESGAVTVALERLMGTLHLSVMPTDAMVSVTPIDVPAPDSEIGALKSDAVKSTDEKRLPVGVYRVTAEKVNYKPAVKVPVEIKPNSTTRVALLLKPMPATIVAPNLPRGTRILINGASVTLPYELPPGARRIRLERDGFQPVEIAAVLKPAQVFSLLPKWIPIAPKPAMINVLALPQGTRVFVNGDPVVRPYELSPGTHTIRLEREGFQPVQMVEVLKPAQVLSLHPKWIPITPKPATIAASSDLPRDTRVLVDGAPVALPHEVSPGTHAIRLERDGFQPVETTELLEPAKVLLLRPRWTPIMPPTTDSQKFTWDGAAFGASLFLPGLGQHQQGRHKRGLIYEVLTIGVGAAAIGVAIYYPQTVENYNYARNQLQEATGRWTELSPELNELRIEQEDAYNRAKSVRTLALAAQIAVGVVWGINAIDAGVTKPKQQNRRVALDVSPTADGGRVLVRVLF